MFEILIKNYFILYHPNPNKWIDLLSWYWQMNTNASSYHPPE